MGVKMDRNAARQQLVELESEFRGLTEKAEALVTRVGKAQLAVQPERDRWSVAQCVAHLTMTTDAFLPRWRESYSQARAAGLSCDGRRFEMDFWGKVLIWILEPPPRFRFPAPREFQPVDVGPVEQVLPAFVASQKQLLGVVVEGSDLPLDRMRITSPFARRMRYSVWSSWLVVAAHQRRHLWQAERAADRVRESSNARSGS